MVSPSTTLISVSGSDIATACAETCTRQVSRRDPSATAIAVSPEAQAVIRPVGSTRAMVSSRLLKVTCGEVACGVIATLSRAVSPTVRRKVRDDKVICRGFGISSLQLHSSATARRERQTVVTPLKRVWRYRFAIVILRLYYLRMMVREWSVAPTLSR
ncbi:Uncharacterised protein [Chlamydia trachomatis]|nr:Uncharacterised protein [Chlamydia trachomatis]